MKKKGETRKERREKMKQVQLGWKLIRLIRHFFPDLIWQLKGVTDQRHQSYIRYENHVLLMTRILASIFYISSMRKASEELLEHQWRKKNEKGEAVNERRISRNLQLQKKRQLSNSGKILDTRVFPGFQEVPVFLFTADGDTLPQFRPGIHKLRDHMADLNEQIVVFHSLTIPAEEMLQIDTMILLGVETLIFNGPSSPAINQ